MSAAKAETMSMADEMPSAPVPPSSLPSAARVAVAFIVIAGLVAAWWFLPVTAWIEQFRAWVKSQGMLGYVIFAVTYAVATVLLAPGSLLTLAAGVAFGLWGFFPVLAGATLGAGSAFLIGRYLARDWVARQIKGNRVFAAIDKAIEQDGWKIVGLMRLSPLIPFILQNYFFGVTRVGFLPYLVTTFFGIMPGTLLFVWLGTLGAAAGMEQAHGNASLAKFIASGVGLAATLIVTIIVSRKAQQKLREAGVKSEPA